MNSLETPAGPLKVNNIITNGNGTRARVYLIDENIKNGRPGYEATVIISGTGQPATGYDGEPNRIWGYAHDITKVHNTVTPS